MTLTDFLLARIAEDEAAARAASEVEGADLMLAALPSALFGGLRIAFPARVLAECEAKRLIVEAEPDCGFDRFQRVAWDDCHEVALRALALPYADHPDYHETWRP